MIDYDDDYSRKKMCFTLLISCNYTSHLQQEVGNVPRFDSENFYQNNKFISRKTRIPILFLMVVYCIINLFRTTWFLCVPFAGYYVKSLILIYDIMCGWKKKNKHFTHLHVTEYEYDRNMESIWFHEWNLKLCCEFFFFEFPFTGGW